MKKLWIKWKLQIVFALGILLVALFLRTHNLNSIPVFVDEAIYIRWSQVMRAEPTLRFLPQSDGKQPLFMWVTIPSLKLISDPLIAGRVVSVFSGLGTLAGIFILSYILFSSYSLSLTASLVYALSPFSVFFDRLALADSMLTAFGVWTLVFAILTVKKGRFDTAMVTGFLLGGALLTKSPGIYFALLIPFTTILISWKNTFQKNLKEIFKYVLLFLPTYLIALSMYNILRLGPNFQMIALRNKDYVYPLSHFFTSPLDPLKPFVSRSYEYFQMLGPSFLIALILVGMYFGFKKYFKETLLIIAWGLIPILISSEFSRTMTARYIYFSTPYFFIIAGLSFVGIYEKLKKETNFLKTSIYVFFGLFVLHSLYFNYFLLKKPESANLPRSERSGYLEDWTSGYGIREASYYFRNLSESQSGKQIVVGTEGFFGTLPDGLQMYLNDLPKVTVIGIGLGVEKIPTSLRESKKFGNRTFLLINNTRLFGIPEKMGLTKIAEYPKAFKPDGTREALLLFELNEESLNSD